MTLTKADLAQRVAENCGFLKGEATEIVEKLLNMIKSRLTVGEDVMISGFGKWSVRQKRARRGEKSSNWPFYCSGCSAGDHLALFSSFEGGRQRIVSQVLKASLCLSVTHVLADHRLYHNFGLPVP